MKFKDKLKHVGQRVKGVEQKHRRTRFSQEYEVAPGMKKVLQTQVPIHYTKDGVLREIDLMPEERDYRNYYVVDKADYTLTISARDIQATFYDDKGGKVDMRLVEVDGEPLKYDRRRPPRVREGVVTWKHVAEDFDVELRFDATGAEWFKILHSDKAPTNWKFFVEEHAWDGPTVSANSEGVDSRKHKGRPRKPDMKVKRTPVGSPASYYVEEQFMERVSQIADVKTRRKEWSNNVAYPVTIDAPAVKLTETAPSAFGNAVWSLGGATGFISNATSQLSGADIGRSASSWDTGYTRSSEQGFGQRFPNVALPRPHLANVTKADFILYVTKWGRPVGIAEFDSALFGVDEDDPSLWTSTLVPGNRSRTTATTDIPLALVQDLDQWAFLTDGYKERTFDVTDIVKEIQARAGWNPGQAMAIIGQDEAGGGVLLPVSTDFSTIPGYPTARFAKSMTVVAQVGRIGIPPPMLEISYTETHAVTSKTDILTTVKSRDTVYKSDIEGVIDHALQGRVAVGTDLGTLTADQTVSEADGSWQSFTHGPVATVEIALAGGSTDEAAQIFLAVTNGGQGTLTWDASIQWAGGSAPTLTAAGADLLKFVSPDGATSWFGEVIGLDYS